MIDRLYGQILELTPAVAVVGCGGVGYEVSILLTDYDKIDTSSQTVFYIHESIREDAYQLYGFLTKRARELFRLLIGVSGVGPNTARLILSSLSTEMLEGSIAGGDPTPLKGVKGVGAKTAQRIIVDLKDKIKADAGALISQSPAVSGERFDDALAALVMLGFTPQQSQKALKKLFASDASLSTEQAIKQALKIL